MKAVIIGAGQAGLAHLEAVRRLGWVDVVGMVASTPWRTSAICYRYNLKRVYTDYAEAVSDPDIDVVHVCTPNALHYPVIKQALQAGKHVLTEKPFTVNCRQAEDLLLLARERGVVHGIVFNYRLHPLVIEARQRILRGEIGRVQLVRGQYLQDWLLYEDDYDWRLEGEANGPLGVVSDIGCHWLDLAEFLSGEEIVSLMVDATQVVPRHRNQQGDLQPAVGEDYAVILLRLAGGGRGVCVLSQVSAGHKNDLVIAVDGSEGSFTWRQERADELWLGRRRQPQQLIVKDTEVLTPEAARMCAYPAGHGEGWGTGLFNLVAAFYRAVKVGPNWQQAVPVLPTFADGLRSMQLLAAVQQSMAANSWCAVAEAHKRTVVRSTR